MGKRGEIFSSRLVTDKRTYFFNVHQNFKNTLSLGIVESANIDNEDKYHRQSILIYQENLEDFLKEMQKAIDIMKLSEKKYTNDKRRDFDGKEVKIEKINSKELKSSKTKNAKKEFKQKKLIIRKKG